jgi:hypothetical protein
MSHLFPDSIRRLKFFYHIIILLNAKSVNFGIFYMVDIAKEESVELSVIAEDIKGILSSLRH